MTKYPIQYWLQGRARLTKAELEASARELEAAAVDLPLVHMLRHVISLTQQDHVSAVDALHRYFDHWEGESSIHCLTESLLLFRSAFEWRQLPEMLGVHS